MHFLFQAVTGSCWFSTNLRKTRKNSEIEICTLLLKDDTSSPNCQCTDDGKKDCFYECREGGVNGIRVVSIGSNEKCKETMIFDKDEYGPPITPKF